MRVPPSAHFQALTLDASANAERGDLPPALAAPELRERSGLTAFRGMPFDLGTCGTANAIVLDSAAPPVEVDLEGRAARWIVFLHAAADEVHVVLPGFADFAKDGNAIGATVAHYDIVYADGTTVRQAVRRRFEIQQQRHGWGASPFAAMPMNAERVAMSANEATYSGRMPESMAGQLECRAWSGREGHQAPWLFAWQNPHPERPLESLRLAAAEGSAAVIFGICTTQVEPHPLRQSLRRKVLLEVPEGIEFNLNMELEPECIAIDLGTVISARCQMLYDEAVWLSAAPDHQPTWSPRQVLVEYAAHPAATLYLGLADQDAPRASHALAPVMGDSPDAPSPESAAPPSPAPAAPAAGTAAPLLRVPPAWRPVTIRAIDPATRQPVGVRLHLHGAHGEYLPPKGYHRKVNCGWFEDTYAELVNGENQYAYIPGHCIADLPLGTVYIEITRGYEIAPIRRSVQIGPDTSELTFEVGRVLDWHARGWITADTHVHFLSPTTAQLEGEAEDVNVVNLLASQWGEMFSNVGDFDGRTTLGADRAETAAGNAGRFLVRVGTENRQQVLGHISLLGYRGPMIHPLCSGGPSESAIGDALEVSLAQWAAQCRQQGGLVVMPHAPNPQCERAADIVLGLVDAMEMMTFNPHGAQLNPYSLADWYRFLNLGYHLPVVGGSDKMAARSLLGGIRTYTQLGERPLTYENWMAATRAGHTFVTVGPLLDFQVEGQAAGSRIELGKGGGSLAVEWQVASVRVPIEAVEIVVGGRVVEEIRGDGSMTLSGTAQVKIMASTWVALRVRGSYKERPGDIAAHSSAVFVLVAGAPIWDPREAGAVLSQIEGALAYVDTLAPRPEAERYKAIRATLESAWNRMHQQMHSHGVYHHHTPVHHHPEHDDGH